MADACSVSLEPASMLELTRPPRVRSVIAMGSGSEYNPYQPPTFDEGPGAEVTAGQAAYATRGERFAAALLDGLIQLALMN